MDAEFPNVSMLATLWPHPDTPCTFLQSINVAVELSDLGLQLRYSLDGAIDQLLVPRPGKPERVDGLWEHTCFEVYLALKDSTAYYEFNFAPSGAWAAYEFRNYRTMGKTMSIDVPRIQLQQTHCRLEQEVRLAVDLTRVQRMGLAAVIESLNGSRSYWALQHPSSRPDFHHPEAFMLEMFPPFKT